ncbi:MAG: His/Gly/Thr/Pro-type tRNA ligase C-terminal domain-containing protein, partial [Brachybacterium tyrofermentans]
DRPKVSPGVKFKDAELLGIPTSVVVGKGLATGVVEIRDRATGSIEEVAPEAAVEALVSAARGA